jgi:hypothetical protein
MSSLETNTNTADGFATVGAQIGVVHEFSYFEAPAGASPEERFEVGLHYLSGGVPAQALKIIEESMSAGHLTSRVRFYWVLAMLSGRTLSQLTEEDDGRLRHALRWPRVHGDDEWIEGLRVIERFLTALDTPKDDPQTAIKAFDALPETQRREILRHLELFLKDKIQDAMWQRALTQARKDQNAGDRRKRVWLYFQPDPRRPRAAVPAPISITVLDLAAAWVGGAVFLAAVVWLGVLTVLSGDVWSLLAWPVAVAGAVPAVRHGVEWHFRAARLRAEEHLHRASAEPQGAPEGGFADDVDRLFRRDIGRRRPQDVDRDEWIRETAGVHRAAREEIVTSFRDSATRADEIAWLIRHRVDDVRARMQDGTLWSYRDELRTPLAARLVVLAGATAVVAGAGWTLWTALRHDPLIASAVTAAAVVTGRFAVAAWLRITSERRRYAADLAESEERLRTDTEAFDRWTARLARRPTDREMAAWLDCDRRILMNQAMQQSNLSPRHVIASAFIAGGGRSAQRARLRNGPWRYSRYRIRVFVLTQDGVRQMTADLDFTTAGVQVRNRTSYRYEAVASVHVTDADRAHPRFRLTLLNGEPIDVEVSETDLIAPELRPDSSVADTVSLDSSGLRNTLHVLEGIAAEGKQWVALDRRRRGNRISMLKKTIEALMR